MKLFTRLVRLEKKATSRVIVTSKKCTTCRHDSDVAPTYRIEFADEAPPRPDFCPYCGRQTMCALAFDQQG